MDTFWNSQKLLVKARVQQIHGEDGVEIERRGS